MCPKDNKWRWWAEWLDLEARALSNTPRSTAKKSFGNIPPLRQESLKTLYQNDEYKRELSKMSKRPAEYSEKELETLKSGDRPMQLDEDEVGEFEDEYEDEFESEEDEIFEAGVDGRPDEEREAEERQG